MVERLAVDIGGTFVDAIRFDTDQGTTQIEKTTTTPDNPTEGVMNAIEKVDANLTDTNAFVHGTTLGINALLEREGATTGLITNERFRDVLEIGRFDVQEDDMYNIYYQKPEPLVPRRRRKGVPGRLNENGAEIEALDEDAVCQAAKELVNEHGVDSIAVCFLHAYDNPIHERTAADVINNAFPELTTSISSDVTNEYREYERTSTTVIDAYIKPIFNSYIDELESSLADQDFDGSFFLTRSGGGAMSAEGARTAPVETILSGPAGGLIGASFVSDKIDRNNALAVDMGGTSLDACVIEDGSPAVAYQSSLEHQPLLIPVYDIRTIGAGGGSIAWLDGELLKVGPKSAGATPGPICYGRGGTEPTVTDAALMLGYFHPDEFLGGEMDIDQTAARSGIKRKLADPQGISVEDACTGVFDVMLANTVSAIREITVEKGLDPRDFSMVAYGGAGPMFNPLLGRKLDVGEVIIPQAPSVFSAWGMMMSDVVYDFSQTNIDLLQNTDVEGLDREFGALEDEAESRLEKEGFDADEIELERSVELRYLGQEHTVEVDIEEINSIDNLREKFEAGHDARYGHRMDDPAEVVHLRVRAVGRNNKPSLEQLPKDEKPADPVEVREAYCFSNERFVEFEVYERELLSRNQVIDGPAIIQEPTTTMVFHSDQQATIDEYGHVIIRGGDR
ncbi:hydantoinase/oxoprolinase family protein [Natrialba sp. INN-245]|uniref:hydantoinase/oxoprolinase family protein n=1 Tax=Natrialba sp. INN-245 TaxID=2690967 RepID=UPI001310D3A3|nr:hydantoinase/oxoprolinase family protein [Natrialba sp. INN-245]MWV38512.1 hydantoinase/oxoprolinase family protein [Natrialba sp. INN-245]